MKHLLVIFFLAFGFISCEKDAGVSTNKLEGKYTLKTVNLNTQFSGESEDKSVDDMSSKSIYYDFQANGSYTTNALWAIGEINKDTKVNTGTYTIDGNVLTIKYIDSDLKKELSQKMQIKANSSTDLILYIGKDELLNSFKTANSGLDAFTSAFLKIYLDSILKFDYTLNFKKS